MKTRTNRPIKQYSVYAQDPDNKKRKDLIQRFGTKRSAELAAARLNSEIRILNTLSKITFIPHTFVAETFDPNMTSYGYIPEYIVEVMWVVREEIPQIEFRGAAQRCVMSK